VRILFLAEANSPHVHFWCSEFAHLGWEVKVASCDYDSDFSGHRLTARAGDGPWRYLGLVDEIRSLVTEFKPHVVNAHFLPTYGLAAAVAKVHPLVLTLWGSDILVSGRRGLLRRSRSRFVLKRADLVVGDSKHLIAEAARIQPLDKTLVVSFGVKRSWYESGREKPIVEGDRVRILSTRRLEPIYDVGTLIRAVRILVDQGKEIELTVVGTGSRRQRLQSLTAELKLQSHVQFTGALPQEKLFGAYRNADIYVSTAKSDSTSVSLLEAMSQKLYPVVTDIPANHEWLESEQHFFEVGDPQDLAAKIVIGMDAQQRTLAYSSYEPTLRQRGIREDQMKVAHLSFVKLIEEYERT
jgi:glycosyltransferase involved in cell wall biosynthesis